MLKFRKKPIVIEAIQWDATLLTWNIIQETGCRCDPGEMGTESFYIQTLEGKMRCDKLDWVIKGVNGEFYPCKPDIFVKTYDLVEDATITELAEFSKNNSQ